MKNSIREMENVLYAKEKYGYTIFFHIRIHVVKVATL